MKFTNSELKLIYTVMNEWYAKRIKFDYENGISIEADKYIELSNEIVKKVNNKLIKRIYKKN